MKKMTVPRLALTFAGCFLGAGYVSGQELWQFFGAFGFWGAVGLILALGVMLSFSVMLLRLAQKTGVVEMGRIVVPWDVKWLRAVAAALQSVFLFGVAAIMSAGAAALLEELFSLPYWVGSGCFVLLVMLVAGKGLQGMVESFSVTVPILVLATVFFAVVSVLRGGAGFTLPAGGGKNPLLGVWFISALTFAGYNLFGSIGMLSPLGPHIESRKTLWCGLGLGAILLFLIAISVLTALCFVPASVGEELPMLRVALTLFPFGAYIYGALLLFAMFGTALSSLVAVLTYFELRFPKCRRGGITAAGGVLLFAGSLLGFGDLIGVLYPLFGYVSILFLLCVLIHFIQCKRKEKV